MITVYQGSTSDLLARLVAPGRDPVTLVCPSLPVPDVLDQAVIVAKQNGRPLRVITSLYGPGPISTRRQLESLVRLRKVGVKVKAADRGGLPSLLLAPPGGCCLLPGDWGWGPGLWQSPVVIGGRPAEEFFSLGDRIWRQAGPSLGIRRLRAAGRWLDEIAGEATEEDREGLGEREEVEFRELSLFDKRRGARRSRGKREPKAWWTFHGTAEDRVNPFLPVRIWAAQRGSHEVIRFPAGRRPTGVKEGDEVFFALHSRRPGGDAEAFIVGRARALSYRKLIDDATDEERAADSYIERFPHALRLENVRFIRGAVGEGIPAYPFMDKLGARCFESTSRNLERGGGNTDPHRSIAQKTLIRLSNRGAEETGNLLEERLRRLGCVAAAEISRYESL